MNISQLLVLSVLAKTAVVAGVVLTVMWRDMSPLWLGAALFAEIIPGKFRTESRK